MKKHVTKIIILVAIFICAIIGLSIYSNKDVIDTTASMGSATLPVVKTQIDGEYVNYLHGYLYEMQPSYVRDSILPVDSSKEVKLFVDTYGENISSAQVNIKTLDGSTIIQTQDFTELKAEENLIGLTFTANDSVLEDSEYLMEVSLETEKHDTVYYYTRLKYVSVAYVIEGIDFAEYFADTSFDKTNEDLISYIEPDGSISNTNLGYANINSTLDQITWSDLAPTRSSDYRVTVTDFIDDVTFVTLQYTITANNSSGEANNYVVNEYFRVRHYGTKMYLLNYERTVDEIFSIDSETITSTVLAMGVSSKSNIEYKVSEKGNINCFVKNSELYSYNVEENEITQIFTFTDSEKGDGVRDTYDQHDIKIANVTDEGDVNFVVYGYMNRGNYEGQVGTLICKYSQETCQVEELAFIKSDTSYQILKETVGKLAYLNEEKDLLYIMMSQNIYTIDLTSRECMYLVSNLTEENYAISEDSTVVAWQTGGDYTSSSIKILNLETGAEKTIRAAEGEYVKVIGFIDEDFVYGTARQSEIGSMSDGTSVFPMYNIVIQDSEGNAITNYSKDGVYVSKAVIDDAVIKLTRVNRSDTSYVQASDDQIMNNETVDESQAYISFISDSVKDRVYVLYFEVAPKDVKTPSLKYSNEVLFEDNRTIDSIAGIDISNMYLAYSYHNIVGVYSSVNEAIIAADDATGCVVDSSNNYMWQKGAKSVSNALTSIPDTSTQGGGSALSTCISVTLRTVGVEIDTATLIGQGQSGVNIINENSELLAYDLTGCNMSQVLYFTSRDDVVMGLLDTGSWVIITSYDSYNITVMNPDRGSSYKISTDDATQIFENAGNRFIVARN